MWIGREDAASPNISSRIDASCLQVKKQQPQNHGQTEIEKHAHEPPEAIGDETAWLRLHCQAPGVLKRKIDLMQKTRPRRRPRPCVEIRFENDSARFLAGHHCHHCTWSAMVDWALAVAHGDSSLHWVTSHCRSLPDKKPWNRTFCHSIILDKQWSAFHNFKILQHVWRIRIIYSSRLPLRPMQTPRTEFAECGTRSVAWWCRFPCAAPSVSDLDSELFHVFVGLNLLRLSGHMVKGQEQSFTEQKFDIWFPKETT